MDLSKLNKAIGYSEYMKKLDFDVNQVDVTSLNETEKGYYDYRKLNLSRSSRIDKTYQPSEKIKEVVSKIENKQTWMILTESWCGDSAQNLPYIAKIADLNTNIDLKILYRDENLEIMDLYLTDGKSRSIPKLVIFNDNGEELFQWGPRPAELIDLVNQWKNEMPANEWKEKIHYWYAKDKGVSLENELTRLLDI
jgi:hypothetical protein